MECRVSIIIPVYNASKHLKEMAVSLFSQTLKEMEFIFIDDCSTDNSLEILYALEKNDPERIIIIKLDENEGPGGARNAGLNYASGEYIGFVDSDDLIKKEMYKEMYIKAIEGDYDLVECGYYSERKNKDMMLWNKEMDGKVSFDNRVKMILGCGFIWSKIYKRSLVIDSGIEFISKIPLEDVDFLSRVYCRVSNVGIIDKSFYYYRDNDTSFSHKRNNQSFFEINNAFCKAYLNNMKKETRYNVLKPVIDYVIIDIWFDIFKSYIDSNNIDVSMLEYIDEQIKKYVFNYEENIFYVEKAKVDVFKKAFLVNAHSSIESKNIINSIV